MARKTLPSWPADGLLFSSSAANRSATAQLSAVLALLSRISPEADPEGFLRLAETARALIRTLLTATAAQRTMNARASRAAAERQRLLSELEALDAQTQGAARALPPESAGLLSRAARRSLVLSSRRLAFTPDERRVIEPLRSLYSRLKSEMSIRLAPSGVAITESLSASAAESALKNADLPAARRQAFAAVNAWFAEKAPLFADLLNAIAAVRLAALSRSGMTLPEAAAADEGVSPKALEAFRRAINAGAAAVRPALSLQARAFLPEASLATDSRPRLPAALLWAPPPFLTTPAGLSTFEGALRCLKAALSRIAPGASAFIDTEVAGGWVQARSLSGGEGGSWTDEVPGERAVAVYADWQPTLGRAFELAHTFGEAYLRHALQDDPSLVRRPPAILCETMGRLFSHALLAHLLSQCEDEAERKSLLWQALTRIAKNLLDLPFRARLTEMIHEERARGYLTGAQFCRLAEDAWAQYFGDATEGCDPYVWARKVHFYRTETLNYDWQYAFGFLASVRLFERLERDGCTACGETLEAFCRDAAWLDAGALFQKHLGAEIEDVSFWQEAHEAALKPLAAAASAASPTGL